MLLFFNEVTIISSLSLVGSIEDVGLAGSRTASTIPSIVPLDYEKIENTSLDTTDVRLMNWKEISFTRSLDSFVSSPVCLLHALSALPSILAAAALAMIISTRYQRLFLFERLSVTIEHLLTNDVYMPGLLFRPPREINGWFVNKWSRAHRSNGERKHVLLLLLLHRRFVNI